MTGGRRGPLRYCRAMAAAAAVTETMGDARAGDRDRGADQALRAHRGIEDVTLPGRARRGVRLPRPQRGRQDDDDPDPARPDPPDAGSARLFGLDSRRDSVAIRARLGNLPGDFGFGRGRGREALALLARLRGIGGLGRAEALAARFRADLDRPLGQLSRGNRQKIGLILAVFHQPELLILDEPTGGLDPLMQEEFLALVAEERDRGAPSSSPRTSWTRSSASATGSGSSARAA